MWQLPFNISKCKLQLHLGQFNPRYTYKMDGKNTEKVQAEKDLRVIIDADLQCSAVVNKANRLLGLIKKSFLCITPDMFTRLYKALARPVLEYGNLIWDPLYITD